jgi:hypothetical protein
VIAACGVVATACSPVIAVSSLWWAARDKCNHYHGDAPVLAVLRLHVSPATAADQTP